MIKPFQLFLGTKDKTSLHYTKGLFSKINHEILQKLQNDGYVKPQMLQVVFDIAINMEPPTDHQNLAELFFTAPKEWRELFSASKNNDPELHQAMQLLGRIFRVAHKSFSKMSPQALIDQIESSLEYDKKFRNRIQSSLYWPKIRSLKADKKFNENLVRLIDLLKPL